MSLSQRKLSAKEIVLAFSFLMVVTFMVVAVLKNMANSITLAKEAKLISYATQVQKMIDGANTLDAFRHVTTRSWVCLGTYSAEPGSFCWGDDNSEVINDPAADKALGSVFEIPQGQMSPYAPRYNRGAVFKLNPKSIEMKIYVGDADRAKVICPKMNMIQNPNDDLSCVLSSPMIKN